MIEEADMLAPELEATARDLLDRLDKWWFEHSHELNEPWTQSPTTFQSAPNHRAGSPNLTTKFFAAPKTFQSTFNASTIARFSSTSLIAYGMLRLVSKKAEYAKEITAHGDCILSAFQYQQRAGAAHTGVLAMLHPLVVLSFQAANRRQRDAAKNAILVWGRARGVGKFVESNIRDHV